MSTTTTTTSTTPQDLPEFQCLNSAECRANEICYHGSCVIKTEEDARFCSVYFNAYDEAKSGCTIQKANLDVYDLCYKVPIDKMDDPKWAEQNLMSYICPADRKMLTYVKDVAGDYEEVSNGESITTGSKSCQSQQMMACNVEHFVCPSSNVTYATQPQCATACGETCVPTYEAEQLVRVLQTDAVPTSETSTSTSTGTSTMSATATVGGYSMTANLTPSTPYRSGSNLTLQECKDRCSNGTWDNCKAFGRYKTSGDDEPGYCFWSDHTNTDTVTNENYFLNLNVA